MGSKRVWLPNWPLCKIKTSFTIWDLIYTDPCIYAGPHRSCPIGICYQYPNRTATEDQMHIGADPGRYMTCGWTGVCRPVFRKLPSSNYWQLPSYPLLWWILAENYPFFAPCLRKICCKRDPRVENFGPRNPPIWAAHTSTLNMLCYRVPPLGADRRCSPVRGPSTFDCRIF